MNSAVWRKQMHESSKLGSVAITMERRLPYPPSSRSSKSRSASVLENRSEPKPRTVGNSVRRLRRAAEGRV